MANEQYYSGSSSYLSYTPIVGTGPTAPYGTSNVYPENEDSKKKSGKRGAGTYMEGLDELRNKLLIEHGLNNEVAEFLQNMEEAIENSYDPITGQPNMLYYKTQILGLNELRNNKEEYDKAYEQAKQKGALDEIALSSSGGVYILDQTNNSVEEVSLDSIEDLHSTHLLSNGELAWLRSHHPGTTNNHLMTTALANSVSMDDVTKSIQQAIQGLGNDKVSIDGMTQREQQNLKAGIEYLQTLSPAQQSQSLRGMSLDGIYRLNHSTETQKQQANFALAWIESAGLQPKMQVLLKAKAMKMGVGVHDLLATFINSKLKNEQQFNIESFNDGKSGNGTSKAGSKDTSDNIPAAVQWLSGYGDRESIVFQKGTQDALAVSANVLGITSKGYNIGFTKLSNIASSDFGGMLNWESVTMADEVIPSVNLNNVVVNGEALFKMDLPIDREAYAKGIIKPDFKWLDKIEEAENKIDADGVRGNAEKENQIYKDLQIPVKYKDGTKVLTAQYRTFGVMNAYSHRDIFGKNNAIDSDFVDKVDDDFTLEQIEEAINEGVDAKSKKKLPSDGLFSWGKSGPAVFASCVFIPVRKNYFNANEGNKNDPTANAAATILHPQQEQNQRLESYNIGEMPE